ncbi:hypothetical protein [Gordonia hankookensis]|uniref:Uncharacterized protein n=1 Tax=Gordonia hankookensis TaxID=589403 RepID=A0ABR7WBL0_9ACTN|nr:hypothetical protein [Gordonia hankookensis]MBD1320199.1 hypothetical protein [Gordonia hankookensis]
MFIIFVITSAVAFVLLFLRLPSLDIQGYQARQAIATRERALEKAARQQARLTAREAAQADRAARPAEAPSRAWLFEFATQMRSFL